MMRRLFPLNAAATNAVLLVCATLSYFCIPVMMFILAHLLCGCIPSVSTYTQRLCASLVFLVFAVYSAVGTVTMYISYFRRRHRRQ